MLPLIVATQLRVVELVIWLFAYGAMVLGTLNSLHVPYFWLLALLTATIGASIPLGFWAYEKWGGMDYRMREVGRLLREIRNNPDRDINYRLLADLYYRQGAWDTAAYYYEQALKRRRDPQTAHWLSKSQARARVGERWPLMCAGCGGLAKRGTARCPHCSYELPPSFSWSAALASNSWRVGMLVISALLLAVGVLQLWLARSLSATSGTLLVLGLLLALLFVFVAQRSRTLPAPAELRQKKKKL
jgi:tetratricopeptide (TPR) repeat protein